MNRLSITLKKLRESREMSMVQLSEKAGVGIGTIGDIERGKNSSTPKTLDKISKGLNLTTAERDELFSCLLPEDIGKKIIYQKKDPVEELTEKAYSIFYDDEIPEEIKKDLKEKLDEAFFMAKMDAKYRDKDKK
ncbi:MAG: helix-turn-helix domain-containing protein [Fusobacteriaceae bacterium]